MAKRLTKTEILQALKDKGYVLLAPYTNARDKVMIQCSNGHEWRGAVTAAIHGKGCLLCSKSRHSFESINEQLAPRGVRMVSPYQNILARAHFQCDKGHEWESVVNSVLRSTAKGCPYCANKRHTRETINTEIGPKGFELLEEFTRITDKLLLRAIECGHEWRGNLCAILYKGSNCPICEGWHQTPDTINAKLAPRNIQLTGSFTRVKNIAEFTHLICGKTWRTQVFNVLRGSNCPHCAGQVSLTREEMSALLLPLGIEIAGPYKDASSRAAFCGIACGHEWRTTAKKILNGTRCPRCAKSGARAAASSFIYVMQYDNGAVKIGVSNEPNRRLAALQKAAGQRVELIAVYQNEDGSGGAAIELEQRAHAFFADRRAALTGFDGASELFQITPAEACQALLELGGRPAELAEIN